MTKKVIIVEWIGIASILLSGGTTSHRAFNVPIEIGSYSKSYLKNCDDGLTYM